MSNMKMILEQIEQFWCLNEDMNRYNFEKEMKLTFIDKHGWPVECVIGRPFLNLVRRLIHTRKIYFGTYDEYRKERSLKSVGVGTLDSFSRN